MTRMLGRCSRTCAYRCCGVWYKSKTLQRRYLKRAERNAWKRDARDV